MLRRTQFLMFLVALTTGLTFYIWHIQNNLIAALSDSADFAEFDNSNASVKLLVPNLIHYVHFDSRAIDFVTFVCILSAWFNHKPAAIYIHTNVELKPRESRYVWILNSLMGSNLKVRPFQRPTHVFGQKLSSVQHASDVARIKILMKFGGIYLDEDVYVVKNLNRFRHFECAIGWPKDQNIGSQVILAHKDARFLKYWMQLYREYRPSMWYYNAGEAPTKDILQKKPELVHRVTTEFGVENLADELYSQNWTGWNNRYTLHLLSNHAYLRNNISLEENNFKDCNCTFSTLAQQVIGNLEKEQRSFLAQKNKTTPH